MSLLVNYKYALQSILSLLIKVVFNCELQLQSTAALSICCSLFKLQFQKIFFRCYYSTIIKMNVAITPIGAKTRPDPQQYACTEPVLFPANQLISSENGANISSTAENGGKYETANEDFEEDIHICGRCRTEFNDYVQFVEHKKHCSTRWVNRLTLGKS